MEVKSLDNELKANIRSGYCVNNVTQCINELVLNSLDANSTHITVRVNMVSFRIQVVDDGEGITETNLEHVGKRNYTNKCHTTNDLELVRKQFGFKGEALASIATNAKVMKISSRAWNPNSSLPNGITFQKTIEGKQHVIEETTERPSGGTTVTVQEFMYNLPVRQKRTKNLEFNDIKTNLQRLFIIHPNVTFSLRDDSTRKIIFSSVAAKTIETALRQQVNDLEENRIKYYSNAKGRTRLKTLMYLKEYENNKWQMFYVNKLPVKSVCLANFVNEILSKSALADGGALAGAKTRKGNNCGNYLYLFNIACPSSKYHIVNYDEVEFKHLSSILKLIEKYLLKILEKEKLINPKDEPKKATNLETMERRIRLSGFPGAFKATAVRRPGDVVDEDIDNFVYNSAQQNRHKANADGNMRKGNSESHDHDYHDYQEQPCILTSYSSSSYLGGQNNNMDGFADKEDNQVQGNVEPLETTSTIGRNYVLKKFIENNPYNVNVDVEKRRVREEQVKEMNRRKYLEDLEVQKMAMAREREKEILWYTEVERARSLERLMKTKINRERLKKNENNIRYQMYEPVPTDDRRRGIPNDVNLNMNVPRVAENLDFYQTNRNNAALANYYQYKHRIKPKFMHTTNKRDYPTYEPANRRDIPEYLWNDARDVRDARDARDVRNIVPFPFESGSGPSLTYDYEHPPRKYNDFMQPIRQPLREDIPHWRIPSETFVPRPQKPSMVRGRYNINTAQYDVDKGRHQMPRVPKAKCPPMFEFPTIGPSNDIHFDDDFDFEQLNKHTFHMPFDCARTPRQVCLFEQTVCDLDLASCNDVFPLPEKRRKHEHGAFFRLRASEKTTRLKRLNRAGIRNRVNMMNISSCVQSTIQRKKKTTTISEINGHSDDIAVYATTNVGRVHLKNLISYRNRTYCKSTTVVTTMSSNLKRTRPQHQKEKVKKKCKKKRKKKVMIRANKGTNTSVLKFQQCVHELDQTVMMMEKSIQCTIDNNNNREELKTAERVQTEEYHNPDYPEGEVRRKAPKIEFICNIVIQPQPLQDPDITSHGDFRNTTPAPVVSVASSSLQDEVIGGTPNEHISFWTKTGTLTNQCLKFQTQDVHEEDSNSRNWSNIQVDDLLEQVKKDSDHVESAKAKRDDTLLFNLSTAIKELAADWSFNAKWPPNDVSLSNTNDIFKCDTNKQAGKLKQTIEAIDIFEAHFSSVLNIDTVQTGENTVAGNEWSRKIDEQGGSYYINKRTGNTMSQMPAQSELINMAMRPIDLPKGFSQNFRSPPHITETISSDTKREFHAAVCESYKDDDDLAHVKWKKHYLQNTDYEEFFKGIYDERFIVEAMRELQLPKMGQSAPNQLNSVAFTADMFHQLDVLRQYDRKFIVAVWQPKAIMVMFDQHAVHERIRLEELLRKYILLQKAPKVNSLAPEVNMEVTSKKLNPFEITCNRVTYETCQKHPDILKKFGLNLTCSKEEYLMIHSVPECIFNKVLRESAKRNVKLAELTKLLICEIVDSIFDAVSSNQWVPRMLINLINSEACRGAVMFGDALSIEECGKLIKDLSTCDLPFQCAHGRPTCVPLAKLNDYAQEEKRINLDSLKWRN